MSAEIKDGKKYTIKMYENNGEKIVSHLMDYSECEKQVAKLKKAKAVFDVYNHETDQEVTRKF